MLDAFEEALASHAAVIIPLRRRMVARTAEAAQAEYAAISGRPHEQFAMRYACCVPENCDIAPHFQEVLKKNRQEDIFRGGTSFGIHREDIALTLNERDMKVFASQGQIRTAALSMKLAQLAVFQEETGESPILLLDDVMSELDMTRRTRLLEEISGLQTIPTPTLQYLPSTSRLTTPAYRSSDARRPSTATLRMTISTAPSVSIPLPRPIPS